MKVIGNKVPIGQRLALERIARSWINGGDDKEAFVIYAEHDTHVDELIYLKDCDIFEVYGRRRVKLTKRIKIPTFLKAIAEKHNIKKLKL